MKGFTGVVIIAIFFSATASAQTDTLSYSSSFFGGTRIHQGERKMTLAAARDMMQPGTDAFKYLQKARTQSTLAIVSGFIGGALIGFELGKMIGGKDANGAVIGVGAGFILVGIPFDISARKNVKRSVYAYNAALR